MAFTDDFTFSGTAGSLQNLSARAGWSLVAGGAAGDAYVPSSGTALACSPSTESAFRCTDQASASHYTEALMLGDCPGFVCVRLTDPNNWIGFRYSGGVFQVYKRVAGSFTQLGSDYSVSLAGGKTGRLAANGDTITFTVDGVARCLGAGVTETFNNTETRQGIVARNSGTDPWLDDFEAAALSTGTPPGLATETDAALALAGMQIRALGMASETDTALALVTLAGLPFNTAPYEFGQRTGLDVADFSIYASTAINVSVYAAADVLLASQLFSYTETTGTDGRLTRKTHASLTAGSTYIFVAVTAGGAMVAAGRITAT